MFSVIANYWLLLMKTESTFLAARLRFRHLQLITELKRSGSLRAAAIQLNLSQPALSKALAEVERAFGFSLFTRNARGLIPTTQGEIAIRGGILLLQELEHMHNEAAAGSSTQLQVRIGAPPFVAQGFLPGVLARLSRSEPPVQVQLLEERVPMLMDMLAQGSVDALVTTYPLERPLQEGIRFQYEKLFDTEFAVIAPPDHPFAHGRRVSWRQLATEPWVMPARVSMVRRVIEESFMREGVMPPVPVVESASPVTNLRLVAAGIGLSATPADLALNAQASGQVKLIKVAPKMPSGPVALVYRAGVANLRVDLLRGILNLK